MRIWQGWVWAGSVALSTVAWGQQVGGARGEDDPANLKGERIQASETGDALPVNRGAAAVAEGLKRLRTRASLLMIVAHPDDEDGGMLTYESRGQGARVGMLTLTRGEGGQNVMSGDFNDALGLVRTRELLAADRFMGVDQMFGTEVDFGFSKTKEEAFSQWTHERVLFDAVRAVRLYRPLVITSVFLGAPTDGHGQHQVSGEIAQEVFKAAGDPKVFPEMGLPVWAPAKVYGRMPFAQVSAQGMFDYATGKDVPVRFENYVTGKVSNKAPQPTVMVPEGEFSSLLGKSYVQFAREGLALQKTQVGSGMREAPAGRFDVGYTRYGARTGLQTGEQERSFFDGVDVSLAGIAGLAPSLNAADARALRDGLGRVEADVEAAATGFQTEHPEAAAPGLAEALRELVALVGRMGSATGVDERERYDVLHELQVKRVQANDALVAALGLRLTAELEGKGGGGTEVALKPGEEFRVKVRFSSAKAIAGQLEDVVVDDGFRPEGPGDSGRGMRTVPQEAGTSQGPEEVLSTERDGKIAGDAVPERPPYTRGDLETPVYTVRDARLRNAPTALTALTVWVMAGYHGVSVWMGQAVGQQRGSVYQPAVVVPPVSVAVTPARGIVPEGETSFAVAARVRATTALGSEGSVRLQSPGGWNVSPASAKWTARQEAATEFQVTTTGTAQTPVRFSAVASVGGAEYREGFEQVGYPGVVRDNLYEPAETRVQRVDVRVPPGLKVAYLPGTGDAVEGTFAEMGVAATQVSVEDIAAGKLAGYDALVMGVRAYAAHHDLQRVTKQLLAYAGAGGVVVVQYNTSEYGAEEAPYRLSLGSVEKVVEERAAVRLLEPEAQALRWPNRITERDFEGWIEERGHGFMGEWAPEYKALTEVHDAGQDPQRGGLLVAPVGKGAYVYCAYALYRQLPEGVPGAFRILANLVSLGRRP